MVSKKKFFGGLNSGKIYHASKCLNNEKIAFANERDSSEVIENLCENEAALMDYCAVPYGFREGPEPRKRFPMFMKRGKVVEISTAKSLESAIQEGVGPTRRRMNAYDNLSGNEVFCGMGWYSVHDKRRRKVSVNDVVKGLRIYAFSELEKKLKHPKKENLVKVNDYGIDLENRKCGSSAVVSVPSRSEERSYRVKLHHFPFIGSDDLAIWPHFYTEHSECGAKDFGDVYWQRDGKSGMRRKQRDVVFCPHDVAAYLCMADEDTKRVRRDYKSPRRVIPLQPFALFTQRTIDFWKKLKTQVFFGTADSARALKDYEVEIEMQRFLARNDPNSTMYASRKIREYDWGFNFPIKK